MILSDLLYHIKQTDPEKLTNIIPLLQQYNNTDWKEFSKVKHTTYNRIKIQTTANFDIYIITWSPGQKSHIHDHAKYGCVLKVLTGTLTERLYTEALTYSGEKVLNVDDVSFITNEMGVHQISNEGKDIAVSLHVYSPTCYESKIFKKI